MLREVGPRFPCPCGREVVLWENGGEGDEKQCECRRTHFLEAVMHHRYEEPLEAPSPVSA